MLHIFIAASIVLATWIGGAPLHQIFSIGFFGVFVGLYVITLVGMRLLRFVRFTPLAVGLYLFVMSMAYFTGPVFKYFMNDMPTYVVSENVPVKVELLYNENVATGEVFIRNESTDPMIAASVDCTIYFDNGAPVEATFPAGFGSMSQFPKGYGQAVRALNPTQFHKYRSNPNDMKCVATRATFVKSPTYNVGLAFQLNSKDFKTDFYVTNKDVVAIKNIQFQCVNDQGRAMRVPAFPSYLTDARKETIVAPNTTVKFTSDEAFFNYTSCFVSNAIEG